MNYLVFTSQSDALAANAQISANMGCSVVGVNAATGLPAPSAQQTTQWAIPVQRLDGKWVFPSPANVDLAGVTGFTVEAFSSSWFPAISMP